MPSRSWSLNELTQNLYPGLQKHMYAPRNPAIQKENPVYIILYIYIIGKPWYVTSWQPPWCSGCTSTPMRKGPSASAASTASIRTDGPSPSRERFQWLIGISSFQSRRKIWKAWIPSFPVYPRGFLWPYPPFTSFGLWKNVGEAQQVGWWRSQLIRVSQLVSSFDP